MNKIELLAPAGSLERIRVALSYGADAVYFGGINYSLRANAKNLNIKEIKEACDYAHSLGKKVYVTVNIIFHNEDTIGLVEYLKELSLCNVDAIIVADPLVIKLVHDNNIKLNIHISTQSSTLNYLSVLYWKKLGIERVVLGRELNREEIKEIIDKTGIEVECFIHGAMCSSYSGRCVLSNYFTNRDANRGGCAQICRWDFDLYDKNHELIKDETKFTMCCKDLSMIDYITDMIDIGITSLKIEGRMRSSYYIAVVVNTYRNLIDDYYNRVLTEEKMKYYKKILSRVANRDNKAQFYDKFPGKDEQYFLGRTEVSNQDFLGVVEEYSNGYAIIRVKNYFKVGDTIEFMSPKYKPLTYKIEKILDIEDNNIDVCRHPEDIIKLPIKEEVYQGDMIRVKI